MDLLYLGFRSVPSPHAVAIPSVSTIPWRQARDCSASGSLHVVASRRFRSFVPPIAWHRAQGHRAQGTELRVPWFPPIAWHRAQFPPIAWPRAQFPPIAWPRAQHRAQGTELRELSSTELSTELRAPSPRTELSRAQGRDLADRDSALDGISRAAWRIRLSRDHSSART